MLYTEVNTVLSPVSMKRVTYRDHLLDVKLWCDQLIFWVKKRKTSTKTLQSNSLVCEYIFKVLTFFLSDKAHAAGKLLCERLKETIPRQLFEIAIQAAIGKKIIARET